MPEIIDRLRRLRGRKKTEAEKNPVAEQRRKQEEKEKRARIKQFGSEIRLHHHLNETASHLRTCFRNSSVARISDSQWQLRFNQVFLRPQYDYVNLYIKEHKNDAVTPGVPRFSTGNYDYEIHNGDHKYFAPGDEVPQGRLSARTEQELADVLADVVQNPHIYADHHRGNRFHL